MKKFLITYFVIITCIAANLNCQVPRILQTDFRIPSETKHSCAHHYKNLTNNNKLLSGTEFRPYNVLSYDVYLDWYNVMKGQFRCQKAGLGQRKILSNWQ